MNGLLVSRSGVLDALSPLWLPCGARLDHDGGCMRREPEDATVALAQNATTPRAGIRSFADTGAEPSSRLSPEERETLRRGELVFPKEADTLTAHEDLQTLPRRDTMPVPAIDDDDDDSEVLDGAHLEDVYDDTQTQVEPRFQRSEDDHTSPTLSLATQSDSAREVYRMFLASEYAPALDLANELIAQGMDDPMLMTIARECRSSLAADASSSPPPRARHFAALEPRSVLRPPSPPVRGPRGGSTTFDATTTIGEVASSTGLSVDQVLGLLERFVGAASSRPPR